MPTSLADMLTDQEVENMAFSAKHQRAPGHAICAAYGIKTNEPLREALRRQLAKAERGPIEALTSGYQINPNFARAVCLMGINPVDLMAIAIWSESAPDITFDDRTLMTVYAHKERKRVIATIHLGEKYDVSWEFDEEVRGPNDAGSIEIINHPLPETVMTALIGKPLETFLTHPITDGAGYIIKHAEHLDENNSTYIELERRSERT